MLRGWRLPLLLLGLLVSLPLQAHKLKVFASVEGDEIQGRAYFVGGAGAGGAAIRIEDATGRELARLTPDDAGRFSYRVERHMDYRVTADSLDGHRASWTLRADEFPPTLPGGETTAPASDTPGIGTASEPVPPKPRAAAPAGEVEAAVARQIRPLREALQAHDEQVRLRDILGGIGYIFGLAGLGLWWTGRRR